MGLLSSVVVLKVDQSLTRSIARKANADITLLNNAVTQWRASYPSVDFPTQVANNFNSYDPDGDVTSSESEYAFALITPFLSLPDDITTLQAYNLDTSKLFVYSLDSGSNTFSMTQQVAN